jgi:CheY-like chemotaxis protein
MNPKDYTVLVAEDEEASRFLYEEELGDDGYRVLSAENGLQVLGILEDQAVDLLVTDVKMPDMNALELVPRIREEFKDLPILVVSAFKAMESEFTLKEAGISGFFAKPVNLEALRFKVKEILEKRKPRREKK